MAGKEIATGELMKGQKSETRQVLREAPGYGAWISVADQLPKDGDGVLGYGRWVGEINGEEGMSIEAGTYRTNLQVVINADAYDARLIEITHWMPLPKAP